MIDEISQVLGISKKSLAEIFPAFFLSDRDRLKLQNTRKVMLTSGRQLSRDHRSLVHLVKNTRTEINNAK